MKMPEDSDTEGCGRRRYTDFRVTFLSTKYWVFRFYEP